MDHFAGLDVSVKETSICIVDETGRIVREARVASEPQALLKVLGCQSALEWDPSCCRISECYPHSAIVLVDATSKYRPRQVAFPACSARGAVGGAGPT